MAQKLKEPGIEWLYEERDIDDLIPWEHNPRIIYEDVYHKLVKSFEDSGDFGVFVVNHEGMLIAGHQRKRALKEFNVKKVLVKYPSRPITDLEFQRVNLADNKLSATFDNDLLSNIFDESVVGDFFDPKEMGKQSTLHTFSLITMRENASTIKFLKKP